MLGKKLRARGELRESHRDVSAWEKGGKNPSAPQNPWVIEAGLLPSVRAQLLGSPDKAPAPRFTPVSTPYWGCCCWAEE